MPVRTCVGCRRPAEVGELMRVAVVDGEAVVDTARRLGGRGAWLHPDARCLDAAVRRRAFGRALRCRDVDTAALAARATRVGWPPGGIDG